MCIDFFTQRGHLDAIKSIGMWGGLMALLADGVVRWTGQRGHPLAVECGVGHPRCTYRVGGVVETNPRLVMNLVVNNVQVGHTLPLMSR